ncbi:Actin-2 [Yarrowia sp. C11]|nr:Actin-2 [Yarrowia sp. E02]KAG5372090.1 Actin-2 [Yarrowia sp. C11]
MSSFEKVLLNQPVVFDNGSGTIKAGYAGEELPKTFFPSCVGRTKHTRVMAGSMEGDTFIGNKIQDVRGLLKLRYPMEHGIVTNWDDMELIWHHVYNNELNILSEDHPLLLTEAPLNPRSNRDRAAQIFFETFNVPALYVSIQAVLALYASGKTTGLVVDSGDGVTHAVPVYEGFSINSAIQRIDIAGRDVTEYLQLLLRKSGTVLQTSAEKEVVRTIKEKLCYVAADPKREEKDWVASGGMRDIEQQRPGSAGGSISTVFKLPDGKDIYIGPERFRAPEIMFNPEIIGSEYNSLPQIVADAIARTDLDLRAGLYGSMLLSGGNTLTRGMGDRLLTELKGLAPKDTKIKIYAPPERKYSTWIGGSILAGLSTFKKMWFTVDEWHENPDIIHTKCL